MTGERKKAVNETFSEIYDAYRDDIFQFCMARLGCDIENSEDCTQESFIVLYNRISKGEEIRNPRAFLYKTAYNITMKAIEKRNRKAAYESSLDDDNRNIQLKSDFNISDNLDFEELRQVLESLLNEREQELYRLYFCEERSIREIAQILAINPHACTVRLSRLRSKMKDKIRNYMKGEEDNVIH